MHSLSSLPVIDHLGNTAIPVATFVFGNIFFVILDLTGKPSVLLKYKMQDEKNVPVRLV